MFYSVSVLCIAFCVYTALTLEPVERLEYGGGYGKWGTGDKYNSTEGLVLWISFCRVFFEAAIYLINSIGELLGKPDISRNKIITEIFFLVVIILCLLMGWRCWQIAMRCASGVTYRPRGDKRSEPREQKETRK